MPEPEQASTTQFSYLEQTLEELCAEIETGLNDLRLNLGERKTYVMNALGLKRAIETWQMSREQCEIVLRKLSSDLLE